MQTVLKYWWVSEGRVAETSVPNIFMLLVRCILYRISLFIEIKILFFSVSLAHCFTLPHIAKTMSLLVLFAHF
jgi:hypothetical protein